MTTLITTAQKRSIDSLRNDLGWNVARLQGFCQRTIKHDAPRTTREANTIYQGLEAILKRRINPFYTAFTALVVTLLADMQQHGYSKWDTNFLRDMKKKLDSPARISPKMVKKVREIAHRHQIECGFPSFKDLAQTADAQHTHKEDHHV